MANKPEKTSGQKSGLIICSTDHDLINDVAAAAGGEHIIKLASTPGSAREAFEKQAGNIAIAFVDMLTIAPTDVYAIIKLVNGLKGVAIVLVSKKGIVNDKIAKSLNLKVPHLGLKRAFSQDEGRVLIQSAVDKHLAWKKQAKMKQQQNVAQPTPDSAKIKPALKKANHTKHQDVNHVQVEHQTPIPAQAHIPATRTPVFKAMVVGLPVVVVAIGVYFLTSVKVTITEAESSVATADMIASATPSSTIETQSVLVDSMEDQINSLLARANASLQYGDLIEPAKLSALYYYSQALELDPKNEAVKRGMSEFIGRVMREAGNNVAAYRLREANHMVDSIRTLKPDDLRFRTFDLELKEQVNLAIEESKKIAASGDMDGARKLLSVVADVLSIDLEVLIGLHSDILTASKKHVKVKELVDLVASRLQQDKLITPAKDSAKYYLMTLRALDPNNNSLESSFNELGDKLLSNIDASLEKGQLDTAGNWLKQLRTLDAMEDKVADRTSALNEAINQQRLALAEQNRQERIETLLKNIDEQISVNKLVEPEEGSARHSLQLLLEVASEDPRAKQASDSYYAALLDEVRASMVAGNHERAGILLDYADITEVKAQVADLRKELVAAQMTRADGSRNPVQLASAAPFASGLVTKRDEFIKPIKLVKSFAPKYPSRAERRKLEGWVHLAFRVNGQGRTSDIEVIEAQPAEIFDSSAIKAVARFRYEVVDKNADLNNFSFPEEIRLRFQMQ